MTKIDLNKKSLNRNYRETEPISSGMQNYKQVESNPREHKYNNDKTKVKWIW
ncbi:hypothetical protein HYE01_00695 [Mycoplasmopsis bovis]|nr:hypothetical protein HYE01_00695 [Mycoplasmopsis bovis]